MYIILFEYYGIETIKAVDGTTNDFEKAVGMVYNSIDKFLDDHEQSMKDYKLSRLEFDGSSGYVYVNLTIYFENSKDLYTWWILNDKKDGK